MAGFTTDLKVAFRALVRKPLFSMAVVLTLGLGIGVNSVAFSQPAVVARFPRSCGSGGLV